MSDNGKSKDKYVLKECYNVIANTKNVCNVSNKYFINTTNDMSEPYTIDIKGPLDDILSAYQNHHSINEIKWRHTVNDQQFEF